MALSFTDPANLEGTSVMTPSWNDRLRSIADKPLHIPFIGVILLFAAISVYNAECFTQLFFSARFFKVGVPQMLSAESFQVYLIVVGATWLFRLRYVSDLRSFFASAAIALLYIVGYIPLFLAVTCVYIG